MKKKFVQGPLGFLQTEEAAKALESLRKTLPKDCDYRKKASSPTELTLVPGERADISLITTNDLDRDLDVILPEGIDLTWFLKNPVVTYCHNYTDFPQNCLARAEWVKRVPNGLLAKTKYNERPKDWSGDWLPDAVFFLTQKGQIKGKSIGLQITKIRSPSREEIEARPEWANARSVIESCMVFEYAICPIPMNGACLVQTVSKGLSPAMLKKLGFELPKPAAKPEPKARPNPEEEIRKALKHINPQRIAKEVIDRMRGRV